MNETEMMTSLEVAELLTISEATLRRWRCNDKGPRYYKYDSGIIRYRREDVDKWLSGLIDGEERGGE
jgi:predicted DNA-binding transcriptional regulator AlpA